jgi:hypothetical protein
MDPTPDLGFYAEPRFVAHIDDGAVGELYADGDPRWAVRAQRRQDV